MTSADIDLRSGVVRVRSGEPDDLDPLLATLDDPSVARWWPLETRQSMANSIFGRDDDSTGLIIEVAGEIAGYIQYYEELDPEYRHAGMDIALGAAFQGRGIGTTAIRLVARHLFDTIGHHRLVIDPNANNSRAIRTYEKAGFRAVGTMRKYEWDATLGAWTDGVLMDLLREEFDATNLDP